MRQFLVTAGIVLLIFGLLWPWLTRLGLGHLPGDIIIERPGFRIYIPLGSSLMISVILSLLFTLISYLWRR